MYQSKLRVKKAKEKILYVCCDLCDYTAVGEKEVPLLLKVYMEKHGNAMYYRP